MSGDAERYAFRSISNVGPFSIASLPSSNSNIVNVVLTGDERVQTFNVHFRVNYTITELDADGDPIDGTTTNHHKDENYVFVVDNDFFAGILSTADGVPTAISAFADGDDRGVVADGKSITCLLYTSPSPRDRQKTRMPSSA